MTIPSGHDPRERVIRWDDPQALAKAGRTMAGRDFLEALLRGDLPLPPICHLADFNFDVVDDGRVEMILNPHESQYNPIGSVHGGIIATVLDSVLGCAVHTRLPFGKGYTTLEIKVNYLRGITGETGPMRAVGRVLHLGSRTAMAEASLSDASGRLFAQASTTCLIFEVLTQGKS
ncbi:PaaI family thioesterase [Rubrivivax sp. JA1024]|nr:PaaI family thioesterase [Rubrivivax sp. JA1024]